MDEDDGTEWHNGYSRMMMLGVGSSGVWMGERRRRERRGGGGGFYDNMKKKDYIGRVGPLANASKTRLMPLMEPVDDSIRMDECFRIPHLEKIGGMGNEHEEEGQRGCERVGVCV